MFLFVVIKIDFAKLLRLWEKGCSFPVQLASRLHGRLHFLNVLGKSRRSRIHWNLEFLALRQDYPCQYRPAVAEKVTTAIELYARLCEPACIIVYPLWSLGGSRTWIMDERRIVIRAEMARNHTLLGAFRFQRLALLRIATPIISALLSETTI